MEGFRSAILQLPKENVTLLSRLLGFFSKVLAKADARSNLTPTTIATVFAPLILREPVLPGAEQLAIIPAQVVRVRSSKLPRIVISCVCSAER